MNRQPNPGSDKNTWGTVLNSYLSQLSPTAKGGINYWTSSTRPTGLTVDDEGRTGVNTQTNVLERWSGTAWVTILDSQAGLNSKQPKTTLTVGFSNADFVVGDYASADVCIQAAITYLASLYGGTIYIKEGLYNILNTITIPKYSGIKIRGAGYPRTPVNLISPGNAQGTRLWASPTSGTLTAIFDWRGDAYVYNPDPANVATTGYGNLAADFQIYNLELNGNNKANALIYALNYDHLFVDYCRLRGAVNSIYADFNGDYPVAGSAKPGGLRISNSVVEGKPTGVGIFVKNATQNWFTNLWFEQGSPYGDSHVDVVSCDKTVFTACEFNLVAAGKSAVRLYDSATDPCNGIIFSGCKFDAGYGQYAYEDLRTHANSKGVSFEGNKISGTLTSGTTLNPQTNLIALAGGYNSNSEVRAGEFYIEGPAGSERLLHFTSNESKRVELFVTNTAEAGTNLGSNFAIRMYNDDGTTSKVPFYISRNDGVTHPTAVALTGTTGNGYYSMPNQLSEPGGYLGLLHMYSDGSGNFSYRDGTAAKTKVKFISTGLTADRTYTLPDASGTLVSNSSPSLTGVIKDGNNNNWLGISASPSAVNYLEIQNRATGGGVLLNAQGADTNVNIGLNPKGTGAVYVGGSRVVDVSASLTLSNKTLDNSNSIAIKANAFTIQDQTDATKQAQFIASGITTANLRSYTLPDVSGTLITNVSGNFVNNISIDRPNNVDKTIAFKDVGVTRFATGIGNTSNNFIINLYDTSGVFVKSPMVINATDGKIIFDGEIKFYPGGTNTGSNTPTIDTQSGAFTTTTLTTAAGAIEVLVLTNNLINTGSKVFVNIGAYSAAYGTNGMPQLLYVTPGTGSVSIGILNSHATNALNGTIRVEFLVINS